MTARHLEWERANVSPTRLTVPLNGSPDDYWLDRFHQARADVIRSRAQRQLPHLQIELRNGEIAASEITEGDHDRVRAVLVELVDTANSGSGSARRF